MTSAIATLIVILGLAFSAYSQSTVSVLSIADAYCQSGCGFGACGASSFHNQTYNVAPDVNGFTGLYFGYPLRGIPSGSQITSAKIYFAPITVTGLSSATFNVAALPMGSIVNETSQSGSTVDQSTGALFRCPGSSGTITLSSITFGANGALSAPLDVTTLFKSFFVSGVSQFVISLTPSWDPFSGGSVSVHSHTSNAQTSFAQVSYTAGTTSIPIVTTTTTTTTTTTSTPTSSSTAAPTHNCWTCGPGYEHWYDLGLPEPSDPCACVATSSSTAAPTSPTSPSSAASTSAAPQTSTTAGPSDPLSTAAPGSQSPSESETPEPQNSSSAPQTERNDAQQVRWTLSIIALVVTTILLV